MAEPTLYVFDGYNLLHAGAGATRDELVDRLAGYVGRRAARGVVVFDGAGEPRSVGPLEVVFSPHADDAIERLAAERRVTERVAIVSSDAAIRETAGPTVQRLSSQLFVRELAAERVPPPSPAARSKVEDRLAPGVREQLERWRRER